MGDLADPLAKPAPHSFPQDGRHPSAWKESDTMRTITHTLNLRRALLALAATAASLMMVLTAVALPAQAQDASGTTITVNTNADEDNSDGDCSLREAINAANTNLAVDACPAGSATGEDTIVFDLDSSATTITVGSRLHVIRGAAGLVIDGGQTADLTVSGGGTSGVFEIGSGAKVAMEGITVSDGFASRSAGGAIDNLGTLTLTDSTVSGNTAEYGGGILNDGDLTLVNSTVSGNTAAQSGGGIANFNDPGDTAKIENSTIAGNTASGGTGGGIFGAGGPMVIENSTVTDNAYSASSGPCALNGMCGAVVNGSSVEVRSTIISGNDGADVYNAGEITSGGYNLVGSVTEADTATGGFDATADRVGILDPELGPLADNGGPTLTNLPLTGSPAIDRGNSFGATADQRGTPRPKDYAFYDNAQGGDGSDVGAVELVTKPVDVSVSGTTVTEGNAGTTDAVFTVRLSEPSEAAVTIDYATEDDTASSPADYDGAPGTVTFAPGDTLKTVAVAVKGDALDEFAEDFFLDLSNPYGSTTTGASAKATIRDDDPTPSLSVNDVTVTEAVSGTATARFAVSLSAASGKTVVADYSTADGTARVADGDYSEASGTLTFRPGVTERTVAVAVEADTKSELTEDLFLRISGADNATVEDGDGEARIEDSVPTLRISDVRVSERSRNAFFAVRLSAASQQSITVSYATANGSAKAPADYAAKTGTLTIAPESTTQTIAVPIKNDRKHEKRTEYFSVNISGPTNATIADESGRGTIVDND